jgi:hypothetical protein
MIQNPPATKSFHFPATTEYAAEYIEAETIQEAEAIYHKIKKPVGGTAQEPAPQPTDTIDEDING